MVTGPHAVALDAQRQVRPEPEHLVAARGVGDPVVPVREAPRRRDLPVVEDRLAHELDLDLPVQALHRPNQHVIGVVVGRRARVGRDVVLALARSHRERVANDHPAARGLPRGHEHVGPRLVGDLRRHVDAERTEPERSRLPVQQAAEDARRVEPRDAQPVDRAVRRDQGSRVTVGQERVVGDRRERRRHRRALRAADVVGFGVRAHWLTHGSCHLPKPSTSPSASVGPHEPLRVRVDGRRRIQQRLEHPPGLLDPVLSGEPRAVATHRGVEEHLVRRRALATLQGELHVEVDGGGALPVGPVGLDRQPDAGGRVQPDHELVLLRPAIQEPEPELRGMLEDQPQLGLGDRQALAGSDEEGNAGPAPALDVETERRERLGRRVLRHPVDRPIALVLSPHVVRGVGLRHGAEEGDLGVLDRRRVSARRRLHRGRRDHLHQVVHHDVAQRADGIVEVAAVLDAERLRHRDLDAGQEVAAPDRFEHRVGEPQVEDLGQAHLPEVVVDPVQLRLVDVLVDLLGERDRGLAVVPERLLDHDARRVGQPGVVQALDHRAEQERRDLQVEDRRPGLGDRVGDVLVRLGVAEVAGDVGETRGEAFEDRVVERSRPCP